MEQNEIFWGIILLLLGGVSWWVRTLSETVKSNKECNMRQRGKLELLEQLSTTKSDALKEIVEMQIGALTTQVDKMAHSIDRLSQITEQGINKTK